MRQPTTSPTPKRSRYEPQKHGPLPRYASNQAYGRNRPTFNEPQEKTPLAVEEAAEEVAEEVAVEVVVAAEEETLLLQEDRPQETPQEGTTDFSDNPRTYSLGTAQRRKSSSHNGNSTTI